MDLADAIALINELRDALVNVEDDRDYYKAIVQGLWPNADDVIKSCREMLARRALSAPLDATISDVNPAGAES